MTDGFIDSASIHSALAALSLRGQDLSSWDRETLLDSTYLLLFRKIGMAPGPSAYKGASGPFEHVVSRLPSLEATKFRTELASRSTKCWLTKNPAALRAAWNCLQAEPEFPLWSTVTRDLFWLHHVRMHASLFNPEFTQHIAVLLDASTRDLDRVNQLSRDESTVRRWLKTNLAGEDAKLGHDAWLAAALIRGRAHEYIASYSGIHLVGHPFRKPVERPLKSAQGEPVYNSEEYLVKIIVGSALLETTAERRVVTWVENIVKVRKAIDLNQIALPLARIDSDAERLAAQAARECRISASNSRIRRELEIATALMIGGILTLVISPWAGPIGPIASASYRHYQGASIGDDLARFMLDTTRRFRRLARSLPGRITRKLKSSDASDKR
jgi:hypothetical protein